MENKKIYEEKILEYRPWIKRLVTPYQNVRTKITVECQNGHLVECKDVRGLINPLSDKNTFYRECPICNSKRLEFDSLKPKCERCGKELTYEQFISKQKFCSRTCGAITSNSKKIKKDSMKKFLNLSDDEVIKDYSDCKSFKRFCQKNDLTGLSERNKKILNDRLDRLIPDRNTETKKEEKTCNKLNLHTRVIGELGELAFQELGSILGITVLKPIIDMEPFDFVFMKENKFIKIQVKTIQSNINDNSYKFSLTRTQLSGNSFKILDYLEDDFEYFGLVDLTSGKCFMLKHDEDSPKRVFYIHKDDSNLGYTTSTMNFEKDYDAETVLRKIFDIKD